MRGAKTASTGGDDAEAPRPSAAGAVRTIELGEEWLPEHFFRELVAAYLAGADEITVTQHGGVRSAARTVVKAFVDRVGGYPACEENRQGMLLWNFRESNLADLPKLTHQLGQLTLELLRRAGGAPSPSGPEESSWEALDDPIDRATWEVHRTVERAGRTGESPASGALDPVGWLEAARAFERIADHAVLLGENGSRWRATSPTPAQLALVADLHERAVDYLRRVLTALSRSQWSEANALIDMGGALLQTARTLVDRLIPSREESASASPAAVVALCWLLHSLERTVAYTQDIAEVLLDHAGAARPRRANPSARPIHMP